MAALLNGMALHGGIIPYGGNFLAFSDYMLPAMRLAAMMRLRVIYVFIHDSIGAGEDGPTHQPVEHLVSLRAIPNMWVIRPADANEVAVAWRIALQRTDGPTALICSRQGVPTLDRQMLGSAEGVARGGYVLRDTDSAQAIIIATGSEVSLALAAADHLASEGIAVRVVSMPCRELFDRQDADYRESVLPSTIRVRVAVEAARSIGWDRYVGCQGAVIGIDHFGASAPYQRLYAEFGLTVDRIAAVVRDLLAASAGSNA
jgi:transketolase